jgi:hypothetical protein
VAVVRSDLRRFVLHALLLAILVRDDPMFQEDADTGAPSPAPPPSRGRTACLIVVVTGMILLGTVGLVVCAGALFWFTATDQPITASDQEVIVAAEDLVAWVPGLEIDPGNESLRKRKHIDGSVEIEYEYEAVDGTSPFYLNSSVSYERNASDAVTCYSSMWTAAIVGLKIGGGSGFSVDERNELFQWGDRSRFGLLMSDGDAVGNIFVMQKEERCFTFMLSGIYFDEEAAIAELLTPVLANVDRHAP